ncbi:MAG: hypothetical protein L6R36_007532 [Xanthoria steineri]|nr:MAG: hypothetical protein L6R36_007532 [Xanthoria steineri]
MALVCLPNELLEMVITNVLPEGFESLATTCKRLYLLCSPFIKPYSTLRHSWKRFTYHEEPEDLPASIGSAYNLITRIALEPYVARYIQHADLTFDSLLRRRWSAQYNPEVHRSDAVNRLFAESPYLKQAGLDWQDYHAKIEEDHQAVLRYSQHAAAFLLTLLPNVKSLILPKRWKPSEATGILIDAVVQENEHSQHVRCTGLSLSMVTDLEFSASLDPKTECKLDWARPFVALPCMRSFYGPSCVAINNSNSIASKTPSRSFATTLDTVHLVSCCIDEVSIANFLSCATQLRTFRYSHTTKGNDSHQSWNLCGFLMSIQDTTGAHLEGLSVTIRELRGSIFPGKACLRGFKRLRKLELPLEISVCNVNSATASTTATTPPESLDTYDSSTHHRTLIDNRPSISDLVPASVSQLSLVSSGTEDHASALETMCQDFASRKAQLSPALEKIFLSREATADVAYKAQCDKLREETENAGVVLDLRPWLSFATIAWVEGK